MTPIPRHLAPPLAILGALVVLFGTTSCIIFRDCAPIYEPVTLASGVIVQDQVVPIEGERAQAGDRVLVHYELALEDGTPIDSSYERGLPLETRLGDGVLPLGIEQGIEGMRVFGRRSIVVPPAMGYGDVGIGERVPPNATLRVTVELMELGEPNPAGT